MTKKSYTPIPVPNGSVIVDREQEIKEGDNFEYNGKIYIAAEVGLMIRVKGYNLFLPKPGDELKATARSQKVIYTIGFRIEGLPCLIMDEAEEINTLAEESAGGLIDAINCYERLEHIEGFKSGYQSAQKKGRFDESDLRKLQEDILKYEQTPRISSQKYVYTSTIKHYFDQLLSKKSFSTPEISGVVLEMDGNKIVSATAKTSAGEIKLKIQY